MPDKNGVVCPTCDVYLDPKEYDDHLKLHQEAEARNKAAIENITHSLLQVGDDSDDGKPKFVCPGCNRYTDIRENVLLHLNHCKDDLEAAQSVMNWWGQPNAAQELERILSRRKFAVSMKAAKSRLELARIKKQKKSIRAATATTSTGRSAHDTGDPEIDQAMEQILNAEKSLAAKKTKNKKASSAREDSQTGKSVGANDTGETSSKSVSADDKLVVSVDSAVEATGEAGCVANDGGKYVEGNQRGVCEEPDVGDNDTGETSSKSDSAGDKLVVSADVEATGEAGCVANDGGKYVEGNQRGVCEEPDVTLSSGAENDEFEVVKTRRFLSKKSRTGRNGERAAFKIFKSVLADKKVTWVNEVEESGYPYDLLVEGDNNEVEFIEVKSTSSSKKDWFYVSMKEYEFACKKRESYMVAYVLLEPRKKPKVTATFRNPVKLLWSGQLMMAWHPKK